MEILDYRNDGDLQALEAAWNRLCGREPRFVPPFSEIKGSKFRLLVAADNDDIVGMACFVYHDTKKLFTVAERKLFALPVKTVWLLGSCILGQLEEDVIAKFLTMIISDSHFDLIDLGEIIIGSPLHKVAAHLNGTIASRVSRKNATHWLIKLPSAFEDYVRSLGSATRKKDVNNFKKLERQSTFDVHVIHRSDQVEAFLQDGEKLSRLTYQWNLGRRLYNDAPNRQRLTRLAEAGVLRCYILYLHGKPCAFSCGELSHKVYLYESSGYDPKYADESPGTALMLWVIRDLINNTDCQLFDFGMGGDRNRNYGYKPRYGNTCLDVCWIQLGLYRPYSLLIIGLDYMLNLAKNFAAPIIGDGKLMKRLKKASRQY
jgi:Acetyltransferase (GNAT) domain